MINATETCIGSFPFREDPYSTYGWRGGKGSSSQFLSDSPCSHRAVLGRRTEVSGHYRKNPLSLPSVVKQVRLMAFTVSGSTNIFGGRDIGTDESLLSTSTNTRSYLVLPPPEPSLTKSTPSFTITLYRSLSWRPN